MFAFLIGLKYREIFFCFLFEFNNIASISSIIYLNDRSF